MSKFEKDYKKHEASDIEDDSDHHSHSESDSSSESEDERSSESSSSGSEGEDEVKMREMEKAEKAEKRAKRTKKERKPKSEKPTSMISNSAAVDMLLPSPQPPLSSQVSSLFTSASANFVPRSAENAIKEILGKSESTFVYDNKHVCSVKFPFVFHDGTNPVPFVYTPEKTKGMFKPDIYSDMDRSAFSDMQQDVNRDNLFITEIAVTRSSNLLPGTMAVRVEGGGGKLEGFNTLPPTSGDSPVLMYIPPEFSSTSRVVLYNVSDVLGSKVFRNFAHVNAKDLIENHLVFSDSHPGRVGLRNESSLNHVILANEGRDVDTKDFVYTSDVTWYAPKLVFTAIKKYAEDIRSKINIVSLAEVKFVLMSLAPTSVRSEMMSKTPALKREVAGEIEVKYVTPRSSSVVPKANKDRLEESFTRQIAEIMN
jgi:hypothetical protein